MPSQSKDRSDEKLRYSSVRQMAEKKEAGFQASYLKIPKGVKLYKPKVGKALIDIIPFRVGKGNPNAEEGTVHWERTFYTHRAIGPNQETLICPARTAGKKCPICEHRAKLMEDEDEGSEKQRKDLQAKQRQLIIVKDLKAPDRGYQVSEQSAYAFGDQIIDATNNAEDGDDWDLFFTLRKGSTLRVNWTEETAGPGRKFIMASRIDFKSRSEEYEKSVLDEVPDLDEMLLMLSYDELKAKFKAISKDDDDDDDDDDGDDDDKPKSKKKSSKSDDDDDDDGDKDDDDDGDDKPKSKKKSKSDDDDDDDGDKDDDDDDDDKPKSKKSKKDDDDDDDDDDGDDDDKPKKKSSKSDDDDDDDDGDDDGDKDEDEPKSKKKKSKDDDDGDDDDWGKFDEENDDDKPKSKKKSKSKSED